MAAVMVMGLQWGDEGKGRVVDTIAEHCQSVIRFNGGPNAGHTIPLDEGKRGAVHQLPSGAYQPHTRLYMGGGMVVDLEKLIREIMETGVHTKRLFIDPTCHVVCPCHITEDGAAENDRGDQAIGTTKTGNGPAYSDKYGRYGIRLSDLMLHRDEAVKRLISSRASRIFEGLFTWADRTYQLADEAGIFSRLGDVPRILNDSYRSGDNLLFECAHGALLDIDHGAYPFVTSSSCGVGGLYSGAGFDPRRLASVVGVMKPYSTRIGAGPFVPEFDAELGKEIREKGGEYGVTTGRPRRIGILDLSQIKRVCYMNGVDVLAVTHWDIAEMIDEVPYIDVDGQSQTAKWFTLMDVIERSLNIPIKYMSDAPHKGGMQVLWGEDDVWGL